MHAAKLGDCRTVKILHISITNMADINNHSKNQLQNLVFIPYCPGVVVQSNFIYHKFKRLEMVTFTGKMDTNPGIVVST